MPMFDATGFRRLNLTTSENWLEAGFNAMLRGDKPKVADIDTFWKVIVEGGEAAIYGIERKPEETDSELAKRVAMAKARMG